MAYETTVPVHRRLLWSAVTDPQRLLGAVPNLTVEASTEHGVAARLRMRVGDRSITFRGVARLIELAPEQLSAELEIEAVHGRSDGALDGRLRLTLLPAGGGTRILVEPDLVLSGRAPTIEPDRLAEAGGKLIPRWFEQLASAAPEQRPAASVSALSVVPDAASDEPESAVDKASEAAEGAQAGQDTVDFDQETEAELAEARLTEAEFAEVERAAGLEPHGPTLTLITGDAQDASPSQKAPLRLVPDSEQDAESEPSAEPDLWSRGRNRLPSPLWILAAAALGATGFAALVLRRLLRRRTR